MKLWHSTAETVRMWATIGRLRYNIRLPKKGRARMQPRFSGPAGVGLGLAESALDPGPTKRRR